MSNKKRRRVSRRRVLASATSVVVLGGTAGCSALGGGSGESGGGTDGGSSGSGSDSSKTGETDEQTSVGGVDPSSVTLAGPGGDAKLRVGIREAGGPGISEFEQLTVFLKELTFEPESGDTATVSVGRLFDLTGGRYRSPPVSFPAGTFTEVTITMPVARAVLADGSETQLASQTSETFTESLEIIDEYMTTEASSTTTFTLNPRPQRSGDSWNMLMGFQY